VDSFVKSPFGLTVVSDASKISGWPAPPPPPPPKAVRKSTHK